MNNSVKYKWIFPSRFRSGAYSWKASRLACQRLREAVSEIKKVAKKEPALGAEGAVRLMEKLWPALEHVDSSSGALRSAVNNALDALIPVIVKAPAGEKTRDKWLDRLWQAMADDLVSTLRACWTDPNPGNYFHGATACLSCLLVSGRHQELLELLELDRYPMWHYRRYGVEALLALGKKADAIPYAEASRGLNQPDTVMFYA